ncbi:glutathione hydrolase 1 proenzyme-like [Lytechinus pictus]|uniref:glutathione hydrolase 1 proenzyme-like n=1 Tax=Lytechinus pictus TaxID=7653 RepID=UPI0030B9B84A
MNRMSVSMRTDNDPFLLDNNEKNTDHKKLAGLVVVILLVGAIAGVIYLGITLASRVDDADPIDNGYYTYREATVASDAPRCSEMGRNVLLNKGSAIDAAITSLLCVGMYNMQSAGLGGGNFILFYDREQETPYFIDARERAPAASHRDMYQNESEDASSFGPLAIGVPGEIKGFWEAHRSFGKRPWRELLQPVIELAEEGFEIGQPLHEAMDQYQDIITNDPSLSEILTDGSGNILQEGDIVYRPKLANTLRIIAESGADVFYTGNIARDIASEIAGRGGLITEEDLADYQVERREPLIVTINNMRAFSGPPPSSGAVYSLIMNILEGYGFNSRTMQSVEGEILAYHRIIEAFKFAYGKRSALGDSSFVNLTELVRNMTDQPYADDFRTRIDDDRTHNYTYYEPEFQLVEDSGTTHISIVDQYGNAAAITSTINTLFGSKVRGEKTGILYNNEMDDFSKPGENNVYGVPPSPSNYIEPGKRPMSSMTPLIVVDREGDVRLVAGASGGPRITLAASLVSVENLWFGSSIRDAIERKRIYHQLIPEQPYYEEGFPQEIIDGLSEKGHQPVVSGRSAVVQGIERLDDGWLRAHCDTRKGGRPSGF